MDNDNSDIVINIFFPILTNYMLLFGFPLFHMRTAAKPRAVSMLKLFSLCLDNVTFVTFGGKDTIYLDTILPLTLEI